MGGNNQSLTTLQQSNPNFFCFLLTLATSAVIESQKSGGSNDSKHADAKSFIENVLDKFYDEQDAKHNFPDYIDWTAKEVVIPLLDKLIVLGVKNMKALSWGDLL